MTKETTLYPGSEGDDWREYRRLVLEQLKQLREDVVSLARDTSKGLEDVRSELAEFRVRLSSIEKDIAALQKAPSPPPSAKPKPSWQEKVLTPSVVIAMLVTLVLLVAIVLGRNEVVAPIVEAIPSR